MRPTRFANSAKQQSKIGGTPWRNREPWRCLCVSSAHRLELCQLRTCKTTCTTKCRGSCVCFRIACPQFGRNCYPLCFGHVHTSLRMSLFELSLYRVVSALCCKCAAAPPSTLVFPACCGGEPRILCRGLFKAAGRCRRQRIPLTRSSCCASVEQHRRRS